MGRKSSGRAAFPRPTYLNSHKKDKAVQLVGFGTFRVKTRKARKGRNPKTGEVIKIPASKTVTFKPGSELKKTIK
jgi:DNA-binding protein HU-beta